MTTFRRWLPALAVFIVGGFALVLLASVLAAGF